MTEDLAALYSDCLEAVRRAASPTAWQALELRLAELTLRLDPPVAFVLAASPDVAAVTGDSSVYREVGTANDA